MAFEMSLIHPRILEQLRRFVARPFVGIQHQLVMSRATLGLLMLAIISNTLSADMYAAMFLGGITLRGDDDYRWDRLRLRRFLNRLVSRQLARSDKIIYNAMPRQVGLDYEWDTLPPKGLVSVNGIKYIRVKPRGPTSSLYKLKLAQLYNPEFRKFLLLHKPCREVIDITLSEIRSVQSSLQKLIEVNQLRDVKLDPVTTRLTGQDLHTVAYFLACFEKSRYIVRRLTAVIPLFSPGPNE